MKVVFVIFTSVAFAQNKFSGYVSINTIPTKNIKMNEQLIGGTYSYKFNSEYMFKADVGFDNKSLLYFGNNYSNQNLDNFKKLKSTLTLNYSKNSKYKYHFSIEPFIANENHLKFTSLYLLSQFKVDFNLKQNKILTVGIGNSSVFGKPSIIPIVNYYFIYNDKLNFNIGFPETRITFSNNSRNYFIAKNDFNGSFYALDSASRPLNTNVKSSFSQITSSLEYERNMDSNWFVNFKAGYDYNRNYLLLDNNYNTTFDFEIKDGFNLGITIKYKQ